MCGIQAQKIFNRLADGRLAYFPPGSRSASFARMIDVRVRIVGDQASLSKAQSKPLCSILPVIPFPSCSNNFGSSADSARRSVSAAVRNTSGAASAMVDSGSSEYIEAFSVIVASGEQYALPHGDSSDDETSQILPGEVVVVDLGARYRGYCTDLTRTFFMGSPTDEMIHIYNITMEAQLAGIQAVRAGARARDVDKTARDIISSYGYGENFTHGLGHGIGLYIHMPPTLSPNSNEVLFQSGDMAITIEPGIYLTGRFGVRIEDDVMVTRTVCEIITHSPKGLTEAVIYPVDWVNGTDEMEQKTGEGTSGENNFLTIGLILVFVALVICFILFKKYKRTHS